MAVKAPLAAHKALQQFGVFRWIQAVHGVVAGHHSAGLVDSESDLKGPEIQLPQRPLGYHAVAALAAEVGVVAEEMLIAAAHAVFLQSLAVPARHNAAEQRILGEILRVPPVEDGAV